MWKSIAVRVCLRMTGLTLDQRVLKIMSVIRAYGAVMISFVKYSFAVAAAAACLESSDASLGGRGLIYGFINF